MKRLVLVLVPLTVLVLGCGGQSAAPLETAPESVVNEQTAPPIAPVAPYPANSPYDWGYEDGYDAGVEAFTEDPESGPGDAEPYWEDVEGLETDADVEDYCSGWTAGYEDGFYAAQEEAAQESEEYEDSEWEE